MVGSKTQGKAWRRGQARACVVRPVTRGLDMRSAEKQQRAPLSLTREPVRAWLNDRDKFKLRCYPVGSAP